MNYEKIAQDLSDKFNKAISAQWLELIHALADKKLSSIDHLKPAIVGQWILECGRGSSKLFQDYWNPAGMKWRSEMEGYAISVYYETDTEPSGGADFCKFADAKAAVEGYFKFLGRTPYTGWREHARTAREWLGFIGKTWCPPGYTESWIAKHGGLKYHEYILDSFWDEAVETLKAVGWKEDEKPLTLEANWFEANRTDNGKAVITAYNENKALTNLYGNPSIPVSELRALFDKYPKAENILVAETDKKIIPDAPRWPDVLKQTILPPPEGRLKGVKILLDAGHSKSKRGAGGLPPDYPDEWEHNVIACQVLKEILEKEGAYCHYEDPDPDNLVYMGQLAKGYDIAIYSHHNAFDKDGIDEGTGIYVHPEASSRCKDFCEFAVAKIATAVGNRNRGVKARRFTVLKESYKVGCPVSLLPEYYFIDDYGNTSVTKPKTRRAAEALAQAVIEYFGKP
ncbi:MAG: N-acetylmuramoyl-L-alanine amidase [Microcystaceae cyanobacterium]